MAIFWITFANPEMQVGSQFVGVMILEAEDLESATAMADAALASPAHRFTLEDISHRPPPRDWFGHLLSAKEARDLNRILCKQAQQENDEDE
jgi:hypothetical protein